ncbi:MerR family transcriptional regulator [Aliiroseovarius sp. CAU 1755]
MEKKSPDAFRTISEVAEWLGVPTHVLRFWESRFSQVKPVKRAGGRRYYRPSDMELLGGIRKLLHEDGMTIRGVQKLLREEGAKHVAAMSPSLDSDDMRDVTPSNVVPLDVQSTDTTSEVPKEPRERAEADLVEDAEIVETDVEPDMPMQDTTQAEHVDASKAAEHVDTSDTKPDTAPDAPSEVAAEAATSAGDQHDISQRIDAETAASAPDDVTSDPVPAVETPEGPTASDVAVDPTASAESPPSADAAPSGPALPDISHIPDDPSDEDAIADAPILAVSLRKARTNGTDAHIAAVQALADRLETLAAQMRQARGRQP